MDRLATCPAGLRGGVVEVDDDDGADADSGAAQGDGGSDGGLLGAGGEAIGCILDIAAGNDGTIFKKKSCANPEVAVGGICVLCGSRGAGAEIFYLRWGESRMCLVLRHGCEAIGCNGTKASAPG